MWLLTSAFSVCYLMGYNHQLPVIHLDHQGPVLQITGKLNLELVYYAVFSFLSLVAFFCAASHAHGSGNAAASALLHRGVRDDTRLLLHDLQGLVA